MTNRIRPDRNLAMELARVTEAAALAAGRWIGRGDKIAADQAAVDAMRHMIDSVSMDGVVVIGEGEKDEAPMLYNGEAVGNGSGPAVDVAVDPIDGTRLTATGQPNAVSVIALAERGTMLFPDVAVYMEKVATGPEAADVIDVTAPPEENVRQVAKAKGKKVEEVSVMILDRTAPRGDHRRGPRRRCPGVPDHRRRRRGGDLRRRAARRRGPAAGDRRHPRGRHRGRRVEVHGWRDPGAPRLPGPTRNASSFRAAGLDPERVLDDRRPRVREGRVLRRDRHHGGLIAARRPLLAGRRHDVFPRDAVAFRHDAMGRSRSTASRNSRRFPAPTTGVDQLAHRNPMGSSAMLPVSRPRGSGSWPRERSWCVTCAGNPPRKR